MSPHTFCHYLIDDKIQQRHNPRTGSVHNDNDILFCVFCRHNRCFTRDRLDLVSTFVRPSDGFVLQCSAIVRSLIALLLLL